MNCVLISYSNISLTFSDTLGNIVSGKVFLPSFYLPEADMFVTTCRSFLPLNSGPTLLTSANILHWLFDQQIRYFHNITRVHKAVFFFDWIKHRVLLIGILSWIWLLGKRPLLLHGSWKETALCRVCSVISVCPLCTMCTVPTVRYNLLGVNSVSRISYVVFVTWWSIGSVHIVP